MTDYMIKIDTSYHEAAHVIVGSLFHIKVESCWINLDNPDSGWTDVRFIYPDKALNEKINNYLINGSIYFNYAGLITDRRNFTLHTGSKKYPVNIKIGASLDIKDISNTIKKYNLAPPGKARNLFKLKMQRKTNKIVEKYWNDIVLITHSLYNAKNNKIFYEDVKNVLTKQSENKLFWKDKFNQIDELYSDTPSLTSRHFKKII